MSTPAAREGLARLRWAGMPLAAQLIALLIGGLVVAQLITALVVLALPPPRAPVYRAADVAAALSGGALQPPYGRRLTLTTETKPPHASVETRLNEAFRRELAQALRMPESRVRVSVYPPIRVLEWMGGGREWERRQRRLGDRPSRP